MVIVTRIYDEKQEHNGKKLYLIKSKDVENNFWGGFTEYIAKKNLPKMKMLMSLIHRLMMQI